MLKVAGCALCLSLWGKGGRGKDGVEKLNNGALQATRWFTLRLSCSVQPGHHSLIL
ncbi:hypothetical protein F751_1338 [Auxenochlorella protothecoides]|uniref:Uncharacterized protein n=1 Tax=Auxenochlorella protothecoides TaxID=3075 RepID=A0A087SEB9_AUXPR|nr:hypothetical protein F751_1338 [Auxenochlorella protothecoides]KFM24073.1 hypothetical protein F751_1338 [Auxenochlorella protothecoides]